MHVLDRQGRKIELELLEDLGRGLRAATAADDAWSAASPVVRAARAFFELGAPSSAPGRAVRKLAVRGEASPHSTTPEMGLGLPSRRKAVRAEAPPAVVRERASGRLRTFYRELVLRFKPRTPARRRAQILARWRLEVRATNAFVREQVVLHDPARRRSGVDLIDPANALAQLDEVLFATPNFVSEYRREAPPAVPARQWHLRNLGREPGQVRGEDIRALQAWETTRGKPAVVVAIVDDGVDLEHPDLRGRIWRNPEAGSDRCGRDFFLPDDHPDHFNPRPKQFRFPYDRMAGNDIHGTPCAGIVAAAGRRAWGVAPRCRVLPVKIFHADELARDDRVADALRYAALRADVLSCSWTAPASPDVELAIDDARRLGRGGRGSVVLAATGNAAQAVGFPASVAGAIAVGASTDGAQPADYSNFGPEVDLVAPSSGGIEAIFTTDVSLPGRGFNVGLEERGGEDGLYASTFGGTSAATPVAAGVVALMLSCNPRLEPEAVRAILRRTATKIGTGYDSQGHSPQLGWGRVDAARAVAEALAAR